MISRNRIEDLTYCAARCLKGSALNTYYYYPFDLTDMDFYLAELKVDVS